MRDERPTKPDGDANQPEELGNLVPVSHLPGHQARDRDTCQAHPAQDRDDVGTTPDQEQRIRAAIQACAGELNKPLEAADNSAYVGVVMILRGAQYLRKSYDAEAREAIDRQVTTAPLCVTDEMLYGRAFDLLVALASGNEVAP